MVGGERGIRVPKLKFQEVIRVNKVQLRKPGRQFVCTEICEGLKILNMSLFNVLNKFSTNQFV